MVGSYSFAAAASPLSGTVARMRLAISTATEQALSSDQPLVLCLRQHGLEIINNAITCGLCSQDELAVAVAVAAGWEGEFGDPNMCLLHHQAFCDIINNSYLKASAEQIIDHSGKSTSGRSASCGRSSASSPFEPPISATPPDNALRSWRQ